MVLNVTTILLKLDTHHASDPTQSPRSSGVSNTFDITPDRLQASSRVGCDLNSVCMIGGGRGPLGRVVKTQCLFTLKGCQRITRVVRRLFFH